MITEQTLWREHRVTTDNARANSRLAKVQLSLLLALTKLTNSLCLTHIRTTSLAHEHVRKGSYTNTHSTCERALPCSPMTFYDCLIVHCARVHVCA